MKSLLINLIVLLFLSYQHGMDKYYINKNNISSSDFATVRMIVDWTIEIYEVQIFQAWPMC